MDNLLDISLNLPIDWRKKLDNLATKKEQSLAELIVDILGQYLGENLENIRLDRLEKESKIFNQRLETLEKKDYDLELLQNRLAIMEKLIASLQSQVISRPFSQSNSSPNSFLFNEEIDDEPDEILTDFLE